MKRSIPDLIGISILLIGTQHVGSAQTIKLAKVVSKRVMRTTELPGEFYPFLSTELHAKVAGYVDKVLVDRGSVVTQGKLLVQLSAPELEARIAQAQAQVTAAESDEAQAEAQLAASQSNFEKLREAAKTQGAVAENDLIQAKQQTDAAQAWFNLVKERSNQ